MKAMDQVTIEILMDAVRSADILGKDLVLKLMQEIYRDYVLNVSAPGESHPCKLS